jgi:Glycosyltransferase family 87
MPTPRWRRILIALYLLAALGDAAGKALAASPSVNRAVARLLRPGAAARVVHAQRPRGNFEIYRSASRHLVSGQDMYARYPDQLQDQFKYSPAFAVMFAPFSWLPWPVALFLWNALGAFVLFTAVERLLPARAAMLALSFMLLEVLRVMQNAQSNTLVAGLIVTAFVALERRRVWRAASAIAIGASVKIFPLAALSFALARRTAIRTGLGAAAIGLALQLAPLLVTRPATLRMQYRSWLAVESGDTPERWFSAMELVHRVTGADWPNWIVQLSGTLVLVAPLLVRRERWDSARFRLLYLCSLLLFVVLFNHQAERAAYLFAFTGLSIWFVSEPRTAWRTALFGLAVVTMPLMSTLLPVPAFMKSPTAMVWRLTVPSTLAWLILQVELWRTAESARAEVHPAEPTARAVG